MNKQIRVAIYSGVSKSTTFIERLVEGLIENHVEIMLFGKSTGRSFNSKFVKYHCYGNKWNKLFRLCKYTFLLSLFKSAQKRKLDSIIKQQQGSSRILKLKYYPVLYYKPDIFHLQWAKSIKDWIWVQDFDIKLIVSLRGTHITISPKTNDYWKCLYEKLFPKVPQFHAVSHSIANQAENYGVTTNRIKVIKSGLAIPEFDFSEKQQITSTLKIVSVGRAHFAKGYRYALDAMSVLKEKGVSFHYTIIGIDNNESLLYQRDQLELKEIVSFKAQQPFKEVISTIKAADIVLLPSVEEGIANIIIEAMALGTLVVSTNCGGMHELVVDNETGFLIPNRDSYAMAKKIEDLLKISINEYNRITKNARQKIESNHSEKQMIFDMKTMYQTVLKNKL